MAMRKWRVAAVVGLMSTLLPLVHSPQSIAALQSNEVPQPIRVRSCKDGGVCKLGDKGPLGGVVFTLPQPRSGRVNTWQLFRAIGLSYGCRNGPLG